MNGGIDEEYDGFIEELKKIGMEEYVEIQQNGYDRFNTAMAE